MTSSDSLKPLLENLTTAPNAGKNSYYQWCDYIEIRCLTHKDKRFSVDNLAEAIFESKDISHVPDELDDWEDIETGDPHEDPENFFDDRSIEHASTCFSKLRLRSELFNSSWPFEVDESGKEIKLIEDLNRQHYLYIQLLLSSLLKYCHKKRWRDLTGKFERISYEVFKCLMPRGAEVHAFGAAESVRYTGHLFERLKKLAEDIRGDLNVDSDDFSSHDTGDGGLDLVAWHPLGDNRKGIPISMGQCGCTAEGWPDKLHQASPENLRSCITTLHQWNTYYFMPLDLSKSVNGALRWEKYSDFSSVIVIDRLRFVKLVKEFDLWGIDLFDDNIVTETVSMELT